MEDKNQKANKPKKKFRASLSEIRKAEIKAQDAKWKRVKRAEQKTVGETVLETEERRKKERERKQCCKEKNKIIQHSQLKYLLNLASQHHEEVMKRIKKTLPSSPNKKRFVVKELFQSLSPAWKKHVTATTQTGKELSEEMKKCIKEFYLSNLNSRVMPGKKKVLSVKLDGLKTKQKKRLLLDDIDNLHQMFNEQYPEHKVGCTKSLSFIHYGLSQYKNSLKKYENIYVMRCAKRCIPNA